MEVPQSILEKIRKLLAKADSSKNDSAAEVETAMAMAQKLMMEYNLSMDSIKGSEQKIAEILSKNIGPDALFVKNEGKWLISLLFMLSRHNFCKGWTINNGIGGMTLVGEDHNIEITLYTWEQIIPRIRELGKQSFRQYGGHEKRNTFLRGFYLGCVNGIDAKLKEERAQAIQDSTIGGLVLRKDAAVTKWMQDHGPRLTTGRATRSSAVDARGLGFQAGKSMSINKGLGGSNAAGQRLIN